MGAREQYRIGWMPAKLPLAPQPGIEPASVAFPSPCPAPEGEWNHCKGIGLGWVS
jgi:hypothetical protein